MVKAYNHIFMRMWAKAVKTALDAFRLNARSRRLSARKAAALALGLKRA